MQHPPLPDGWPASRAWPFADSQTAAGHPSLERAWSYSRERLTPIIHDLEQAGLPAGVECLAVCGSFGRMEGLPHSDCDLSIIVEQALLEDAEQCRAAMQEVWHRLEVYRLKLPKEWGIFAEAHSIEQLTDPASTGQINESVSVFGTRMQLLLDAQPIAGAARFATLQSRVLDWYAGRFLALAPDSQWHYLRNDVMRYFRAYCVWQQFELRIEDDDSWYVRNTKLKTSRTLMIAGMLLLLAACSQRSDKPAWLLQRLRLTPLERVDHAMRALNDARAELAMRSILQSLDQYTSLVERDEVRSGWVNHASSSLDAAAIADDPDYLAVHALGEELVETLSGFLVAVRDETAPEFWNHLIF